MNEPQTAAGRRFLASSDDGGMEWGGWIECHVEEAAPWVASIEAEAADRLIRSPRFRDAVRKVFEAPGEFGPAQGYYASDIDHFIEMLAAVGPGDES